MNNLLSFREKARHHGKELDVGTKVKYKVNMLHTDDNIIRSGDNIV